MGDLFVVPAFIGTFREPIAHWRRDVENAGVCSPEFTAKWESPKTDLSHFKYADDIHTIVLADFNSTLPHKLQEHDGLLNNRLAPVGLGQNMTHDEARVDVVSR
eukprot:2548653-Pyramimonas_sp.AAC.1